MNTSTPERRSSVRIPADTLQQISLEDDIIHIDTILGDFAFESDAIVRWTMGSYVGVEFLDSRARNAVLLAELYTEKLLSYLDEPEH